MLSNGSRCCFIVSLYFVEFRLPWRNFRDVWPLRLIPFSQTMSKLPLCCLLKKERGCCLSSCEYQFQTSTLSRFLLLSISELYGEPPVPLRHVFCNRVHSCLLMVWFYAWFEWYYWWTTILKCLMCLYIMSFELLTQILFFILPYVHIFSWHQSFNFSIGFFQFCLLHVSYYMFVFSGYCVFKKIHDIFLVLNDL